MRKWSQFFGWIALAAGASLVDSTAMADGVQLEVDIGGVNSWDLVGDPDNEVMLVDLADMLNLPPGSEVTMNGIGWDVELAVSCPSWFSDATMSFADFPGAADVVVLRPGVGFDFCDSDSMNFTVDAFKLQDVKVDDIVVSDGVLEIEFFESFDDFVDGIDATWLEGSTVTIQVVAPPLALFITNQPVGLVVENGGPPQMMEVTAENAETYQWRFNGQPISDGLSYSGTDTSTLTVVPNLNTEGAYDVVVSDQFHSVTSHPAVLAVTNPCPADVTGDAIVNVFDLLDLLSAWGACP